MNLFQIDAYFYYLSRAVTRWDIHSPLLYRFATDCLSRIRRKNTRKQVKEISDYFAALDPSLPMRVCDGEERREGRLKEVLGDEGHPCGAILLHIHRDPDRERRWERIVADPFFHVTVDLFRLGLVFRLERHAKEHFVIRY